MSFEIDYFEGCDTNAHSQAAYVSNAAPVYGSNVCTGGTASAQGTTSGSPAAIFNGSTSPEWYWVSHSYPQWFQYDLGSGVTKVVQKIRLSSGNGNSYLRNWILKGSNNGSDFTNITSGTYTGDDGWQDFTFSNTTAYRYYRVSIETCTSADQCWMRECEMMEVTYSLQSYSGSEHTQGSYSLKVEAAQTDSLNKTLTKTFDPPKNLSGKTQIKLDMYSSRTGSNVKIGFHDSGGTTTEYTPNITSAGEFQTFTVDISGVSNANKDAIDSIILTQVNADSATTWYLDNVYATTSGARSFGVIII